LRKKVFIGQSENERKRLFQGEKTWKNNVNNGSKFFEKLFSVFMLSFSKTLRYILCKREGILLFY